MNIMTPRELSVLHEILRTHIPGSKIWVFGSRVKGTARPGSDLDLAVDIGAPLPFSTKARLADELDEAKLSFNVDIVDLATVSPEFRASIDAHKIALPGFD